MINRNNPEGSTVMSGEKKKILILIPRMGGGGAERVVSIIANNLCDKYDICITTLVSKESFYELKPQIRLESACFEINRASKLTRLVSMGSNFISSISYVKEFIKGYEPDIVFSLLEEMDIVSYLATKGLKGFKRINSERNDPHGRSTKLQMLLERIYRKTDMLVCQSQTVSDYYCRVMRKTVIPNPVDFHKYPEKVAEAAYPRIVGVGRLREQKNFIMLEKAFAKIADQFPDVTVTVYGEGPDRQLLESEIKKDHLIGRFNLPGESRDILNEIKDAAVFAFPTNFEGFPNALVEAIAMGIPVVTTDFATGVAKEIVDESVGIVVPVGDVDAFSVGLEELLSNKEKRNRIRKEASKAVEPFAMEKVIQAWDELFQTLLEDR